MEHFFALHPNAGAGETPRKQALESVKSNIEWVKRNQVEIQSWLDDNVSFKHITHLSTHLIKTLPHSPQNLLFFPQKP